MRTAIWCVAVDPEFARANHCDADHSNAADLATLSDDELAGAAAIGDRAAFDELVVRMTPPLLRYLRRMVADAHVAEDIAQEALLDAWKGLDNFAFRSTFRTWMFSIAHRKCIDYYRRHREFPADEDELAALTAPAPDTERLVEHASLREALMHELELLPPTSRACWWLREVEGLPHADIAGVLRITPTSVRGHLQRSRHRLADRLAPWRPTGGETNA